MSEDVGARAPENDEPATPSWIHLRWSEVSLLLQLGPDRLPVVRHWGADLGDLTVLTLDAVEAVFDTGSDGQPLVAVAGEVIPGRTRLLSNTTGSGLVQVGADIVIVEAQLAGSLSLDLAVQLTDSGVVRCRAGLTNRGAKGYPLGGLQLRLPVGVAASDQVELGASGVTTRPLGSGRWTTELEPEPGRPAYLVVGTAGSGYSGGEVWQSHVASSGAVRHGVERSAGSLHLVGGERLEPGEVVLELGESYHSPWVLWSYGAGLDEAAARMHAYARRDLPSRTALFDARGLVDEQDRRGLLTLAEYAAAIGVGTFLLDLDWCVRSGLSPHTDSHGHSEDGLPQDLDGLLARLRALDLEVGLAITPEVSEVDAAVVRDHPDWLTTAAVAGSIRPALDLAVRPAMGFVWERLTKLLDRYEVSWLHWDLQAAQPGSRHAGTRAAYRLLDALRERYPQLAITTGNADLAIAGRAYAVPSPDADDLLTAFDDLSQILPVGLTQVAMTESSAGGLSSAGRAVASLFGQLGLRLDLRRQSPATLRSLHRWLAWHQEAQTLLRGGWVVRADQVGFRTRGVVAGDGSRAIYAVLPQDRSSGPRRLKLPGLDPTASYRIEVVGEGADWLGATPRLVSGALLAQVGLPTPPLPPGEARLLAVQAAPPS